MRRSHQASDYRDGDVIGILPTEDPDTANEHVDIGIPSGLGIARNALVVRTADAVIAVGGGAGTLSEMAMAWQLGRPVVGLDVPGWSSKLSGEALDGKRPDTVVSAATPAAAIAAVREAFGE